MVAHGLVEDGQDRLQRLFAPEVARRNHRLHPDEGVGIGRGAGEDRDRVFVRIKLARLPHRRRPGLGDFAHSNSRANRGPCSRSTAPSISPRPGDDGILNPSDRGPRPQASSAFATSARSRHESSRRVHARIFDSGRFRFSSNSGIVASAIFGGS